MINDFTKSEKTVKKLTVWESAEREIGSEENEGESKDIRILKSEFHCMLQYSYKYRKLPQKWLEGEKRIIMTTSIYNLVDHNKYRERWGREGERGKENWPNVTEIEWDDENWLRIIIKYVHRGWIRWVYSLHNSRGVNWSQKKGGSVHSIFGEWTRLSIVQGEREGEK